MDWYPWYPTDFKRDTYHLSLAQEGAYRRLIDEYMMTRKPLADDDYSLARILGVGLEEWLSIHGSVKSLFRVRDGKLFHKRCGRELAAQDKRYERFSERGKKAAFAKYVKNVENRNRQKVPIKNYSAINGQGPRRMLIPPTVHNKDNRTSTASEAEAPKEGGRGGASVSSELERVIQAKRWAP